MIAAALEQAVGLIWGMWLVVLLAGTGLFLTVRLGLPQIRGFRHAIDLLRGKHDDEHDPGEISHFQALSAALSATIGLGNIAGVAIAVSTGGPGALVWMWLIGFIGMATKAASCTLSVMHRQVEADGTVRGGPMYYIEQGLGPAWRPVAMLFAGLVAIASFGGGNMFQANQVAEAMSNAYGMPRWLTGLGLSIGVALVIIGGIRRIGQVASRLVPAMCLIYIGGAVTVLLIHAADIPAAFAIIFADAFTGNAVAGGIVGEVIRQGVRRGTFSNEAGLGSAPIAHAAAKTQWPAREGLVAMLGPFIDTIVVCTMTGLVIVITGFHTRYKEISVGVGLTAAAFDSVLTGFGTFFVNTAVLLFAFSTMISWSYYGEQGAWYLFGRRSALPFKAVFVAMIFVGAVWKLDSVVNFSDASFGLMAIPNVLALILLSGKVRAEHDRYREKMVQRALPNR